MSRQVGQVLTSQEAEPLHLQQGNWRSSTRPVSTLPFIVTRDGNLSAIGGITFRNPSDQGIVIFKLTETSRGPSGSMQERVVEARGEGVRCSLPTGTPQLHRTEIQCSSTASAPSWNESCVTAKYGKVLAILCKAGQVLAWCTILLYI
ncbi:hypothetical protein An09g02480 [Aspergillus niger]|uniref:Uncharacterized protein n=2 Tax=Aspergillus niger TaxID=5061 RepID=A2QTL0_ASPNC|nr:hypothetical protein An09g02480 [Aspergillus niger]CAK40185.1 hypothetical protein An09g02480 [Aspergillus niger]